MSQRFRRLQPALAAFWVCAVLLYAAGVQAQSSVGAGQAEPADRTAPQAASIVHVRGIKDSVYDGGRLLASAVDASPTVRQLVGELEQSTVVVFVELRDRLPNGRAQLTFVTARAGLRWLRISIDAAQPAIPQIAFLAHELRHAVEVAAAAEVQSLDEFRQLYERIGIPLGGGHFETAAAIAAGNQTLREVNAARQR